MIQGASDGLFQGAVSCELQGQAPESAKHLLQCESLDIRRRRIFQGKPSGE